MNVRRKPDVSTSDPSYAKQAAQLASIWGDLTINAVQFDGVHAIPRVVFSPVLEPTTDNPTGVYGQIETPEGFLTCIVGDWIVTGLKDAIWVLKPAVFAALFEPAD